MVIHAIKENSLLIFFRIGYKLTNHFLFRRNFSSFMETLLQDKLSFRLFSASFLFLTLTVCWYIAEILFPNTCRGGQDKCWSWSVTFIHHTCVKFCLFSFFRIYLFLTKCLQPRNQSYGKVRIENEQSCYS